MSQLIIQILQLHLQSILSMPFAASFWLVGICWDGVISLDDVAIELDQVLCPGLCLFWDSSDWTWRGRRGWCWGQALTRTVSCWCWPKVRWQDRTTTNPRRRRRRECWASARSPSCSDPTQPSRPPMTITVEVPAWLMSANNSNTEIQKAVGLIRVGRGAGKDGRGTAWRGHQGRGGQLFVQLQRNYVSVE